MTTKIDYAALAARAMADTTIGERFVERHTPGPNNACKADGCNGTIESRLYGAGAAGNYFKTPACCICGREYLLAHNVRQVGFVEFHEVMEQTYSI
ncbi:TPA: hypothetical protein DEP94_02125 [Candidatus Nomurabacteria bacterium]|nr:hypothetical protein [Candidatus Nomurabacteria bacterium]